MGTQDLPLNCPDNTGPGMGMGLSVDANTNSSPATRVVSPRVLAAGVRYTLIARGSFRNGPQHRADTEFTDFAAPRDLDRGVDIGLRLAGVTVVRAWGSVYRPAHVYVAQVLGQGQRLGAWYHDVDPSDNNGTLSLGAYGADCLTPDIPPD